MRNKTFDYTSIKRQSPKNGIVHCPKCGKMAQKRGHWKMQDGTYNRLYIHGVAIEMGLPFVKVSCIVNETVQL